MPGKPRDDDGYSLGSIASRAVAHAVLTALRKQGKLKKDLVSDSIPQSHLSDLLSDAGRRRFQRWQIIEIAERLGTTEEALLPKDLPRKRLARLPELSRVSDPVATSDGDESDRGIYVKSPYAGLVAHAAEEFFDSLPEASRRTAMNRILDAIEKERRAHPRKLGGE
jgi:hypothetical protein